jgi:hypothetical protein
MQSKTLLAVLAFSWWSCCDFLLHVCAAETGLKFPACIDDSDCVGLGHT